MSRDWIDWKVKETMKLNNDIVWIFPNIINVKERDYNQQSEWDGNGWRNEWDRLWYMKWCIGKYVTLFKNNRYTKWNNIWWIHFNNIYNYYHPDMTLQKNYYKLVALINPSYYHIV